MDKVIGYVKVFLSEKQSALLPGQIKQKNEIKKYCENNKLFLEKIIVEKVFDEKSDTPILNDILYKKNNDDKLRKVVVFKSSVIGTDSRFYLYCCFLLAKREVELVSIKEDFTKESRITPKEKSLVYAMAFYDKKRMGFLLKEGRAQKRLSGELIPGASPYGYKKINGQYEIDASEAEVVKLIFKMKEKQNKSANKIADFLNKNGIQTRQGKIWRNVSVCNILNNKKVYQGYILLPGTNTYKKGHHAPIL